MDSGVERYCSQPPSYYTAATRRDSIYLIPYTFAVEPSMLMTPYLWAWYWATG